MRGPLNEIIGRSEFTVETENHARVLDVLNLLTEKHGKPFRDYVFSPTTGKINSYLIFSINGVNIASLKGIETTISDNDELLILSATGGG